MGKSRRLKKLSRDIFKNMDFSNIENLSEKDRKYISKKIHKETNFRGEELRTFPCQITGKDAFIPFDAKPTLNEEDGKWYIDDKLIVSDVYYKNLEKKKISESIKNKYEIESRISKMQPEILGDENS